jgi:RNA polymerase sigma-70 factor, ECF subfamily
MTQDHMAIPYDDPDRALLRAMAAGDSRALDELYSRYGPAILSYLAARLYDRAQAEEVLQDVMLAVWRNAANFRGESKVLTWMLTIARNRAVNAMRKHQVSQTPLDDVFELQSTDTGPVEKLEKGSQREAVREALKHLPEMQREILELVFYHQLSGQEVADVLGINQGTVKSRLHRAKEALRRALYSEGSL